MKLALHINNFSWPGFRFGATLAEIARSADSCGFDRIGVADHLWQHPIIGGPEAEELECYSTLAFLAANTKRARLMAMASGVHFRHPGVLAKTVSTLDVLSGGRATLGIGAGHYEEEAHGLGIPFPPLKVGEVIGGLRWLSEMGIETVIGFVPDVYRITPLESSESFDQRGQVTLTGEAHLKEKL
jgi:hypothetical protein